MDFDCDVVKNMFVIEPLVHHVPFASLSFAITFCFVLYTCKQSIEDPDENS